MGSKSDTLIDFPLENLDLSDFVLNSNLPSSYLQGEDNLNKGKVIYELYSVSNHIGSMGFGHYTAYCKYGNQWMEFDDQDVSKVNESDIVSSNSYVLFYKRKEN